MVFEVRNLTKVYGDRKVLDIPELRIEKGKVYGLLGPNGSGKTTLLEILSFLMAPTSGDIAYNDRKVDFSRAYLQGLRREVAMVEQQPILFTTSVYKNVEFGLRIRKVEKERRRQTVLEVLDLVGMRDFAQASAHKLSGGETQRVAIARALACSPKVVLFDEPTSNVDIENQVIIERIVRDINAQKGISVIFTTHNRIQAAKLSDHIVFLFKGRPAASVYENIFSGPIMQGDRGARYCFVHDKVMLPVQTEETGQVTISIDPGKAQLLPARGSPVDSGLVGHVVQLSDEGSNVRALIDIGIPISVLLENEAYRKEPILTGDKVFVICPPQSIEIV